MVALVVEAPTWATVVKVAAINRHLDDGAVLQGDSFAQLMIASEFETQLMVT